MTAYALLDAVTGAADSEISPTGRPADGTYQPSQIRKTTQANNIMIQADFGTGTGSVAIYAKVHAKLSWVLVATLTPSASLMACPAPYPYWRAVTSDFTGGTLSVYQVANEDS